MNVNCVPYEMMNLLSEAVAILDERQEVIYCNASFDNLYNPFQNPKKKTVCQELQDLVLKLVRENASFVAENVIIPLSGQKLEVLVFPLLTPANDNKYSLVMVKMEESVAEARKPIFEEMGPTYITESRLDHKTIGSEFQSLKGTDLAFRLAILKAQQAAPSELPILLTGASGTGKEVLAKAIHMASSRSNRPFIDINCAAVPDSLIESEFFGYEKGAFTDARVEGKKGLFEEGNYGTLFLDEIGDISLSAQSKILRVLEEKKFRRVGGTTNRDLDVRIISATNKDLKRMLNEGLFREDLYYRINTIRIHLPSLRNRINDIPLLAQYFLNECAKDECKSLSFSEDAIRILKTYNWPGNARELKAVVEYAVTMSEHEIIKVQSLPSFVQSNEDALSISDEILAREIEFFDQKAPFLPTLMREIEKQLIRLVMARARNKSQAIKMLGVSRRTFYHKLKEYDLVS